MTMKWQRNFILRKIFNVSVQMAASVKELFYHMIFTRHTDIWFGSKAFSRSQTKMWLRMKSAITTAKLHWILFKLSDLVCSLTRSLAHTPSNRFQFHSFALVCTLLLSLGGEKSPSQFTFSFSKQITFE